MSGRSIALKPASLAAITRGAIARRPARADLAVLLQRARGAIATWRRVSRERIELLDSSAHMLRDIGLARAESSTARDRIFWRV
jgi:uncharacterized protein YjiS (DUF1127 family)